MMTETDTSRESLTDSQWQIVHAIAQSLVKEETDVNELGKAIAYLRNAMNQDPSNAVSRFFKYLKTLVANGRQIGHSARTSDYYRSIDKACSQYLQNQQISPHTLLQILGWVARLMRYYKEGGAIDEFNSPILTDNTVAAIAQRQEEIAEVLKSQQLTVGQAVEARVASIKGNKVTYEIFGTIKLTQKEPKKYQDLTEEQVIRVEIIEFRDDGGIKKVKCLD